MSMGSPDLLKLVLQFGNHIIFAVLNLLDALADGADRPTVDVSCLQDLVQLQVLHL